MIGIIGGSSLQNIKGLEETKKSVIRTPFGIPSAPLISGRLHGQTVVFLARHGLQHTIPPHMINYRANVWALHHLGCQRIFAFSTMCSIVESIQAGSAVIPNQLIDYTRNRAATFFESIKDNVQYTAFTEPYSAQSRQQLITAVKQLGKGCQTEATYGITQGPRYETLAEINRYRNDGSHLLGMTGMPEAILAKELDIDYAVCGFASKHIACDGSIQHIDDAVVEQYFLDVLAPLLTEVCA